VVIIRFLVVVVVVVVVVIGDRVVSSLNQLDRIFVSSFDQAGCVFTTSSGEKVSRARDTGTNTEPKHENKAREIGRVEETEMMGNSVEDLRTIDLDLTCSPDHDGATPDERN
ncbi:hypothetical protein THAOC_24472, partial [Thalassiosira oceanica]